MRLVRIVGVCFIILINTSVGGVGWITRKECTGSAS